MGKLASLVFCIEIEAIKSVFPVAAGGGNDGGDRSANHKLRCSLPNIERSHLSYSLATGGF